MVFCAVISPLFTIFMPLNVTWFKVNEPWTLNAYPSYLIIVFSASLPVMETPDIETLLSNVYSPLAKWILEFCLILEDVRYLYGLFRDPSPLSFSTDASK